MSRWGAGLVGTDRLDARARRGAHDVRPDRAGLRRDEPADDRRPRRALAPAGGRRSRCGRATACSTPPAARATSRVADLRAGAASRDGPRLLRADARAGAAEGAGARVGRRATCSRCRSPTGRSTPRRSASASATSPTCRWRLRELRRVLRPGGRLAILEITQPRGALQAVLLRSGSTGSCPLLGRVLPGRRAPTPTCPPRCGASRPPRSSRELLERGRLRRGRVPAARRLDRRRCTPGSRPA